MENQKGSLVWKSTIKGDVFDYLFWCPGCEQEHGIRTAERTALLKKTLNKDSDNYKWLEKHGWPTWTYNGNGMNPTVTPSIHIQVEPKEGPKFTVCHLFVENGKIRFLNDCRHKLAGQVVPMEPDPFD